MARKKRKTTRRKARRRTSSRPIVLQLPPPARRRKRKRRRNPAAATIVNPSRVRTVRRRRRRRKRNPSLPTAIKRTFRTKTLLPILIGGGLGVVGISASQKWIAPRLSPKWQALAEAGIGIAGLPVVNKLYSGAGPYFTGFMVGSALTTVIKPLLPFGMLDGDDELDAMVEGDMGAIEFIGDGLGDFSDAEAEAAAAGDDGLEEVVEDQGADHLVDGLGVLPPVAFQRVMGMGPGRKKYPPALIQRLRAANLLWLLRLGIPAHVLIRLLQQPLPARTGMLKRWRRLYLRRFKHAKRRHGRRFRRHPYVVHHPRRRPGGWRRRAVVAHHRLRRARRAHAISGFGDADDPMVELDA